ncbi:hypothetical protein [Plantactinospora sp. B5E13]|uniref:hypothetical protein n=1 Tax=Plantactinospora sp. B5E13 TaxID=3153758 RepID=UPI00325E830B
MAESVEVLERRIDALRAEVRRAVVARDNPRTRALRAELRAAERAWEQAITDLADTAESVVAEPAGPAAVPGQAGRAAGSSRSTRATGSPQAARATASTRAGRAGAGGSLLPVREQVHHALTLLCVPAASKLIADVHEAFFDGGGLDGGGHGLAPARLTHLRRDERRSYETARHSRPYYLCAALTADHLTPARGLFGVSTWPLERRIVGPLSPRVDFLTAAVRIAERAARMPQPNPQLTRLLWRFATNIPGASAGQIPGTVDTRVIIEAAEHEREVHAEADRAHRAAAADRARRHLDDVAQLFGHTLDRVRETRTA